MESGSTWILLFQEQWQVPAASGKEALRGPLGAPVCGDTQHLTLGEGTRSFSPTGSSLGQAGETAEPLKAMREQEARGGTERAEISARLLCQAPSQGISHDQWLHSGFQGNG